MNDEQKDMVLAKALSKIQSAMPDLALLSVDEVELVRKFMREKLESDPSFEGCEVMLLFKRAIAFGEERIAMESKAAVTVHTLV